jgi:hypothetical protein
VSIGWARTASVVLVQRLPVSGTERAVGVDGRGHDVAFGASGEGAHGDRGVERVVAHLVEHDIPRRLAGKGIAHGGLVAAVDADTRDARAERIGRIAARGDRHAMAGPQQALYQQAADVAGAADHQDILGHDGVLLG